MKCRYLMAGMIALFSVFLSTMAVTNSHSKQGTTVICKLNAGDQLRKTC